MMYLFAFNSFDCFLLLLLLFYLAISDYHYLLNRSANRSSIVESFLFVENEHINN